VFSLTLNTDDKLAASPVPGEIVHFIPDDGSPDFKGRAGLLADQDDAAEGNNGTHGALSLQRVNWKLAEQSVDILECFISRVRGNGGVPGNPGGELSGLCNLDSGQRTLDLWGVIV